jgi:hypothetical protein
MALRSFIMVECICVTYVFIELARTDRKEDKQPVRQLVQLERYT